MAENDESEILEEIVNEVIKTKTGLSIKPKLLIKVPKKESVADDELSDEETVEKLKPKTYPFCFHCFQHKFLTTLFLRTF